MVEPDSRRTIEIEDIKRLDCHPGETVLFTVPFDDPESCRETSEEIGRLFEIWHPGVHILVLSSDTKVEILPATEEKS